MARMVIKRDVFDFRAIGEPPTHSGYKTIFWFLISYSLFLPAASFLAPSEANLYTDFIEGTGTYEGAFFGKDAVAISYAALNRFIPYYVVTTLITILYYLAVSSTAKNIETTIFHSFISIQILAFSSFITKESVLILIAVLTFCLHRLEHRLAARVFFLTGVLSFAVIVRQYYIPLIALYLLALVLRPKVAAAITVFGFMFVSLFDSTIIEELTGPKNQMIYRAHTRFLGVSTALPFAMIYEFDLFTFLEHYFRSLFFLLFPILWLPDHRGLYAQLQVIVLFSLVITALRRGDPGYATFGVGIMMTMVYIVPDLGTWVRHASTGSVFLFLALMVGRNPKSGISKAQDFPVLNKKGPRSVSVASAPTQILQSHSK